MWNDKKMMEKWWENHVVDRKFDGKKMGKWWEKWWQKHWENDGRKAMLDNYAYSNFIPIIKQPQSMVLNMGLYSYWMANLMTIE